MVNYAYRNSLIIYFKKCFLYALIGIILSLVINYLILNIQNYFNLSLFVTVLTHLLISILVLYTAEILIMPSFGEEWQTTTPGLFFASLYFGIQIVLYARSINKVSI